MMTKLIDYLPNVDGPSVPTAMASSLNQIGFVPSNFKNTSKPVLFCPETLTVTDIMDMAAVVGDATGSYRNSTLSPGWFHFTVCRRESVAPRLFVR
jgi:hypothetical protein